MSDKPNILWIFSDQHRAQAMSCAGDPNIETPNMDRLAKEGIRFTNAYSNTPLCSPFRASLYTGQYINKHKVISLHRPLLPVQPFLAEVLSNNGYYTSHMGKWHLSGGDVINPFVSPYFRPGWKEWLGWEASNRFFNTYYSKGDMPWEEDVSEMKLEGYQTDALTDLTIAWLYNNKNNTPWFHVISVEPPHSPNIAPEPYMEMFREKKLIFRENFDHEHENAPIFEQYLRGYYAQIKNLDDNIGRIINALEETGQLDNTIIFYFSDHGDFMGSHGRWQKIWPHEESSNIPFIVRYPAKIKAGTVSDAFISGVDIMPTLLGFLNIPIPSSCQGDDLHHIFENPEFQGSDVILFQFETPYIQYTPHTVYRAIRYKEWMYIYYLSDDMPNELYNMDNDPYQMNNLAYVGKYRGIVDDLKKRLREKLIQIEDNFVIK